jgi:GntR family transcriptional repressor for pyruvate dehydrogenase complex
MERDAIPRRRLSDEVKARLERMIHSGEYAPGDQLPSERDLMEHFGVGRPSVREALFSLQQLGLVTISSGERARVTLPTPERLLHGLDGAVHHLLATAEGERNFQDARLFFEVGLARHAASFGTPEDVRRLELALGANRRAMGDVDAFERTDVAFHYVLAEIPRNPVYLAIHEAVVAWLTRQRTLSLRNEGAARQAYNWHVRIFEAVVERDPDAAEAAMRDHLEGVAELYWQARGREQ